jgi:hypothetical protein
MSTVGASGKRRAFSKRLSFWPPWLSVRVFLDPGHNRFPTPHPARSELDFGGRKIRVARRDLDNPGARDSKQAGDLAHTDEMRSHVRSILRNVDIV